ncbi:MAG TPA: response regulator [Polyangiales bacterium]|nr:response regulator [Polyangiales bacterium]
MARILAVDDSVSMRRLVGATLAQAGHEVAEVANGAEGLNAAKQRVFNLVISDMNMPIMDGLTFIKTLRGVAGYRFTPILVLTTEMDPEKKRAAKEAGATGWIVKPFDPEQLLATIRKVLG